MTGYMKGYQVVVEDNRSQYEEPGVNIGNVYLSLEAAEREFRHTIEDAKTNTVGDYDWLADAIESRPNEIKEKWETERFVTFKDMYSDSKLSIYINEIEIISVC